MMHPETVASTVCVEDRVNARQPGAAGEERINRGEPR